MAAAEERGPLLPPELERQVRVVLEFHRWGGTPEGVTAGETIYGGYLRCSRERAVRLSELCGKIALHLGPRLNPEAANLFAAGRMYRKAADYVRAVEYFLRGLEALHREGGEL